MRLGSLSFSSLGVVLIFTLAGCANVSPAKEYQFTSRDKAPVEILSGISTFVHFCYGTAPSFDGLENKALSGSYERAPNGWLEHSESNLSMVVRDHGDFNICQLGFVSNQPISLFEKQMNYPFNARELTKPEFDRVFRSGLGVKKAVTPFSKMFASRATFDEIDTSAMFFGFIIDDPQAQPGENGFGLFLQVSR